MKKYFQPGKKLIIGCFALFFITSLIPVTEGLPIEQEDSSIETNDSERIYLSGAIGENGWIIGPQIFHLQFALTISWQGNATHTPISNGETRQVNITIGYTVTRGAFGKFLLRLLEGRSFTIRLSIEDTPEWCEPWFTQENFTGVVQLDENEHTTTSLFIHVNDDAPNDYSQGWVKAHAWIEDLKGPFRIFTLILGYEKQFTISFVNGPHGR